MKICVLCLSVFLLTSIAAQAELLIITNKSVAQSSLSKQDIKDIFLGNKQYWTDKSKISFAVVGEGDVANSFFKTYLGMSTAQYNGLWSEKLYTGGKTLPKRFKSSKQVIDFISQTAGAIGFIDNVPQPKDVNVIEIK